MRTGVVGSQTGYRRAFCVTGLERRLVPPYRLRLGRENHSFLYARLALPLLREGRLLLGIEKKKTRFFLFYALALHYLCPRCEDKGVPRPCFVLRDDDSG